MADSKQKKDDPTVSTETVGGAVYPPGTHPAKSPSETSFSADRITYKDNPDKPDPSTVAQIAVLPDDWPGQS